MGKKVRTCPNCGTEGTLVKEISKLICNECGAICKKNQTEAPVKELILDGNNEGGSEKMTGVCRRFEKGWGFVISHDGQEYFAHQSAIQMNGYRYLVAGQEVEFDVDTIDPRGPRAVNIIPGPEPADAPKSFRSYTVNKEVG